MSAVSMEPDDKHCNPLLRARGTRTASIVLGAIMTLLTIAYTTTRAATNSAALGKSPSAAPSGYSALGADDDAHDISITSEPTSADLRRQALRAAVEQGSLPASALDEDSDDEDGAVRTGSGGDDEKGATQYSYSFFHIIFLMATAWTATLLTMSVEKGQGEEEGFQPVGRTYAASWVKIFSAWACYGIYTWTLVAPWLLPDRFDY